MNQELARFVRERAGFRCEYCLLLQFTFPLLFQIDHVIAEKHGGATDESNLALACAHCNRYKGPNIAGFDTQTSQVVRLFHPRTDTWTKHFEPEDYRIAGKTSIGRVTVHVLELNAADQLVVRIEMAREDYWPRLPRVAG